MLAVAKKEMKKIGVVHEMSTEASYRIRIKNTGKVGK